MSGGNTPRIFNIIPRRRWVGCCTVQLFCPWGNSFRFPVDRKQAGYQFGPRSFPVPFRMSSKRGTWGRILSFLNGRSRRSYTFWWSKIIFFCGAATQRGVMASSFLRFLDHTQRRTTVSRTPLDEWSARRRDLYLTTHNRHNRQISMPRVELEPTISAGERLQSNALDRAIQSNNTI